MIGAFKEHFNEICASFDTDIEERVETFSPGTVTRVQISEHGLIWNFRCLHQRTLG
jgi:hypothetical protein